MTPSTTRTTTIAGHTVTITIRRMSKDRSGLLACYRLPDGRRKRLSCGTSDLDIANIYIDHLCQTEDFLQDFQAAQQDAHQSQGNGTDKNPRLREIQDYYVDTYLPNRNAATKSITKAVQIWDDFAAHCRNQRIGRFNQLSTRCIDSFATALRKDNKAPKTIKNALGTIRAGINVIIDAYELHGSPVRRWSMPKVPDPEIATMTIDELSIVLALIEKWCPLIFPLIQWMAFTGNRTSDVIDLRWRQVSMDRATVTRTQVKTKRLTRYTISAGAVHVLRIEAQKWHERRPNDRVFLDDTGKPFSIHRPYQLFTRALERAKHPERVNLKTFRHTFASIMANVPIGDPPQVCPLPVLQVLMGHRDIATTLRYVHPPDADVFVDNYGAALEDKVLLFQK